LNDTKNEAIRYFENILGARPNNNYPGLNNLASIVTKRVTNEHFNILSTIPDDVEIKSTFLAYKVISPQALINSTLTFSNIASRLWGLW